MESTQENDSSTKKVPENRGGGSNQSTPAKTKRRSSLPKLPLYSSMKVNSSKEKRLTVDDILKPLESLDNGLVSKTPKPSHEKNQTLAYDVAETLLQLGRRSLEEASGKAVRVASEPICTDSGKPMRQTRVASNSEERSQDSNFFKSEANAAPSILNVSDFDTCTRGLPKKGILTLAEFLESESHLMTVTPSAIQETNSTCLTPGTPVSAKSTDGENCGGERIDSPELEADANGTASVQQSADEYYNGTKIKIKPHCYQALLSHGSDNPAASTPVNTKPGGRTPRQGSDSLHFKDVNGDSPDAAQSSADQSSSVNSVEGFSHVFESFKSASGRNMTIPQKSHQQVAHYKALFYQGSDPPAASSPLKTKIGRTARERTDSLALKDVSGNSSVEAQSSADQCSNLNAVERSHVSFESFKSASGKTMSVPACDRLIAHYAAQLYQGSDPPVASTSMIKKPRLDPVLESGAGLLQRFETPKCNEITEEQGVDRNSNVTCSKTLVIPPGTEMDNFDYEDMDISPDQRCHVNPPERVKHVTFESFVSCSGKKPHISQGINKVVSKYQALLYQGCDPPDASPLRTEALIEKPQLDSFLEDDTELFRRLKTPPKCDEINKEESVDGNSNVKCPNADIENGHVDVVDIDYDDMPQSPVLNVSYIAPQDSDLRSPKASTSEGENIPLNSTSLQRDTIVTSSVDASLRLDVHSPVIAAAVTVEERVPSPSPVLMCGVENGANVEGNGAVNAPVIKNMPSKESCPEWEDFPELKLSQAVRLEQSGAKKETIAPDDKGQRLRTVLLDVETDHSNMKDSETCVKPSASLNPAKLGAGRVQSLVEQSASNKENIAASDEGLWANSSIGDSESCVKACASLPSAELGMRKAAVSTPLSSRTLVKPLVGTKRKSLPVSLGFAAKKPRPSPQDAQVLVTIDGAELKTKVDKIIASKKEQKISPAPGILLQKKRSLPQLTLMNLTIPSEMPVHLDDFKELFGLFLNDLVRINSENAVRFRFPLSAKELKTCDKLADSCVLSPKPDGTAGLEEVTRAFMTCPHVDPKLVPAGWVKNHYRWIVWKLASYDRRFPQIFSKRCLSVENVLLQLKYRYDRELDLVERPAFRKILECDAPPKKFICCLASVKKNRLEERGSLLEFELTDGWYSIWALIDTAMVGLYQKGVIGIGSKLVVHGAEIKNCEQGCDPLNVPSNVKLMISTNSVRRAKWCAKMGFLRGNSPVPNLLCDVLPDGGMLGKLTTVVVRKYPVVYRCQDADGKPIYRNERSQAAFKDQLEKRKLDYAEKVQEELIKEAESNYIRKPERRYTAKEIASITDPEELFNIWSANGEDGEYMQSQLSSDQFKMILNYKDEIASKINGYVQKELQARMAEWQSNSQVTRLLKVRLMDSTSERHAVLTIWNPNEDDERAMTENKAFKFFNIIAKGTREGVLQLSSTRQTTLEVLPSTALNFFQPTDDFKRVVTPLGALESPNFAPPFSELDVVGVVIMVKVSELSNGVTVVYISDFEGHYLSITFWADLSVFGCEDIMTDGSLIACSNLQWRPLSSQKKKIPSVFATEITSFAKSPKQGLLRLHLEQMKSSLADKDIGESVASAKAHVNEVLLASKSRDIPYNGVSSPAFSSRPPSAVTPVRSTPVGTTPSGKTTIGTSYKSTPISTSSKSTPISASSRSTPAAQKLQMLNRFGDNAPPLPSMALTVTSETVFRNFKSPCITPKGDVNP